MKNPKIPQEIKQSDAFVYRHIGNSEISTRRMLDFLKYDSVEAFIDDVIPESIRLTKDNYFNHQGKQLEGIDSESLMLERVRQLSANNVVHKSYIGQGYYGTQTPSVIRRNVLENPCWYTPYTPYQPEIAQGRLESLLNYQTAIMELTGMDVANASLLDEATGAAEAVQMAYNIHQGKREKVFCSETLFPQTIDVIRTKCHAIGIDLHVGKVEEFPWANAKEYCGMVVQNPDNFGNVSDHTDLSHLLKESGVIFTIVADILSLNLVKPPGRMGADIAVGSAQRMGIPFGYGGPHPGYFACMDKYKRKMPGRIIGISKDVHGNQAFRMAMQTREQHIRRDKATSNICTAQALLANMAAFYMQWHGPAGLKKMAVKCRFMSQLFMEELDNYGIQFATDRTHFFDTVCIKVQESGFSSADFLLAQFHKHGINLRKVDTNHVSVSFDEVTTLFDVDQLIAIFASLKKGKKDVFVPLEEYEGRKYKPLPDEIKRMDKYMNQNVFRMKFSETNMMRYIQRLSNKDVSLVNSMIPLGSCTMKLNSAVCMIPITWYGLANMHPFAPIDQAEGYKALFEEIEHNLIAITQYDGISSQPHSGATGEYAGLMAIKKYHESRGDNQRNVCLCPVSAHGTNPATAQLCGMKIVPLNCDEQGNIMLEEVKEKAKQYADKLSCIMVTYPSTHGVFEASIKEICAIIHLHGGQVYMDGANMNAQLGLTSPGSIGADVGHLNLHKTFAIPHGGGGPGVGSIGFKKHLEPFVPGHCEVPIEGRDSGAVAGAPYGNAGVVPISYSYIKMSGKSGLREAAVQAILNANYMADQLDGDYKVLYRGETGRVAHEFILDCTEFKQHGVTEEDIAKRLIDYGFHAPTVSWPVVGGIMIEPTESEDINELDRYIYALKNIRKEIQDIIDGKQDAKENLLKLSPFTLPHLMRPEWNYKFTREEAGYPAPWLYELGKVFPYVGRVDNVYGDRNFVCACPPVSEYFNFEDGRYNE